MEAVALLLAVLIAASHAHDRVQSADARAIARGVQVGAFAVLVGGGLILALFFLLVL